MEDDSRGIVDPASLARLVDFARHDPSAHVARFVDWYWHITWDIPTGAPYTQEVLARPAVNLVLSPDGSQAWGLQRRRTVRVLEGRGEVLGVLFRPAGFAPLLSAPVSTISDRSIGIRELFGEAAGARIDRESRRITDGTDRAAHMDAFLAARLPIRRVESEDATDVVELAATDPGISRVDQLARATGYSARSLQRMFSRHVGASPKWVIRRFRLHEVAERAVRDDDVDWAALADELAFSDQAHLIRDFTRAIGVPPARYAERSGRFPAD